MFENIRDCNDITMAKMPSLYPKERKTKKPVKERKKGRNGVLEETKKLVVLRSFGNSLLELIYLPNFSCKKEG